MQSTRRFLIPFLNPLFKNNFPLSIKGCEGVCKIEVLRKSISSYPSKWAFNEGVGYNVESTPPSKTGVSNIKTMLEVRMNLSKMMGTPTGYKVLPPNRSHLIAMLPLSQEELPTRSMKDSQDSATILLSASASLQDRYATALGTVRIGRLLEDLDLFAVWIALKYIKNPKGEKSPVTPYTIVTAGVDFISFTDYRPKALDDLKLSGCVVSVGKSSMEVECIVETLYRGEWKLYIKAYFIMVARNSTNTTSAFVNKLVPDGPEETQKYKEAQQRKESRGREQKMSLLKSPPTPAEQRLTHDKFMKTVDIRDPTLHKRLLPNQAVWMDATRITNTMYPQPENRNHHNTVFGGFLMRIATELSWIIAFEHGRSRPFLCHISDFSFRSPVPITAFMYLSGQMTYTEMNYAQVVVNCEMFNAITKEKTTTNEFHYTYRYTEEAAEVMPLTYLDSLRYLDGYRHFEKFRNYTNAHAGEVEADAA